MPTGRATLRGAMTPQQRSAPAPGPEGTRSLTPSQVIATLEALRRGDWGSLTLERFLCFARFPKWTAACYALHWAISEDTAGRDLKDLQRAGVIACLQGRGHGGGGREPDLWFLTRLGARVLTRHRSEEHTSELQSRQ